MPASSTPVTSLAVTELQRMEIPAHLNISAVYPIALTQDSRQPEQAATFVTFLFSEEGTAVLESHGFSTQCRAEGSRGASEAAEAEAVWAMRTTEAAEAMRIPVDRAQDDQRSSRRLSRPGIALFWSAVPMILFLTLPLLALIWRTELTDISTHLAQPVARRAIVLSLWTSATATLLTILLGTPLAVLMTRRHFRGRRALDTLIDLPTVLPPAVAGLALLMAFGRRGMLGQGLSVGGNRDRLYFAGSHSSAAFRRFPLLHPRGYRRSQPQRG